RSKSGGIRYGEMETQCTIGTGLSEFLKDRLLYGSDHYEMNVCKQCGLIAHSPTYCKNCNELCQENISKVDIPYAAKLLFQEMMSMGVRVSMKT
ncbi:DNA-directed RNA polymerase III subunit RPC2, partial [Allomyces javanicus]